MLAERWDRLDPGEDSLVLLTRRSTRCPPGRRYPTAQGVRSSRSRRVREAGYFGVQPAARIQRLQRGGCDVTDEARPPELDAADTERDPSRAASLINIRWRVRDELHC